jgi:hypothetical protein
MNTTPTASTTPAQRTQQIVREYTSLRAFHHDAQQLYASSGYTVSHTVGLSHRGLKDMLPFFWPLQRHLSITYDSPTNPPPPSGDADTVVTR